MIGALGGSSSRRQTGGPTPPTPASGAGFTTRTFFSDFTSTSEVATTSGATTGAKWYWSGINSTSQFSINTGAGSGSTAGATGILTLSGSGVTYADALATLPGSQNGATGAGTFKRGYFAARMQFGHLVAGAGGPSGGWPSFWMFQSALGAASAGVMTSEVDIMESFPSGTAGSNSTFAHTMHNWLSSSGGGYTATDEYNTNANNFDSSHQGADDGWHTHGCLWTGDDTSCQISFYMDNILLRSPVSTGVQFFNYNTSMAMTAGMNALPPAHQILHLGCATSGWPVNVDSVEVWQ